MKNTIRRVFRLSGGFGYHAAFASLGAAESATVLVTDSATGVKHLPGLRLMLLQRDCRKSET